MANEIIKSWSARELRRNTMLGYEPGMNETTLPTGFAGVALAKDDSVFLLDIFKIHANATLTTGIKLDVLVVDDGKNAADLGKVARLGAKFKTLVSGTDNLDMATNAGTEVAADVTLDATSGEVVILTISIPNASLDSAAASSHVAFQLRRIGSHANDTLRGRLLVLGVTAYAY